MGVLIDSQDMSEHIVKPFLDILPRQSYRVVENKNGSLRWYGVIDGKEVVEDSEPQASRWRRFKAFISRILPETQL